ncbi:hypothetical protein EG68_01199 [Paragonimus skrjabini miyazakii]|uniref:EF-hand domain-containing protein n=1 Tax=Paragonimus skrjabini miyazakii TaxID=59628 RepID=A0A8S9Z2B8_9TREM|nr:hypothetical protein EG68_01199 [Paragonimus skrjabini miyazakii]
MGGQLTPKELLQIFDDLDRDGNGVVTLSELERGLVDAGLSLESVKHLMKELDLNEDGKITLAEYKLAVGLTNEPLDEWKRLFYTMDRDRTGKIDKDELKKLFKDMGMNFSEQTLECWIADHDSDGDGMLNYHEFMDFVAEQAGF